MGLEWLAKSDFFSSAYHCGLRASDYFSRRIIAAYARVLFSNEVYTREGGTCRSAVNPCDGVTKAAQYSQPVP